MKEHIVIRGYGTISVLGHTRQQIFESYQTGRIRFQKVNNSLVAALDQDAAVSLDRLKEEKRVYRDLDRSVLMAIHASRQAIAEAGWEKEGDIAINIGSSRGATSMFEQYITEFNSSGSVPAITSPVTTLGNVSSWVAQDLNTNGAVISHSVTCSTGLQAIANGFAWLKSGMADKFLAGASEAPLTPFTIAQMKALGIYSDGSSMQYPCRPFNLEKKNTFVLGEGAAVFALEKLSKTEFMNPKPKDFIIESVGLGFESISSKTGVSREGNHFKAAIENALKQAENPAPIDMIIMHAPGTLAGDYAELNAIKTIFKGEIPILSSLKWMTGHSLGASGCLSLDYALYVLQTQSYLDFPYPVSINISAVKKPINRILITAAGFGGNAAALIVSKAENCR